MRTAALVADPAGDADRKPEAEVALEFRGIAGEAVRDAADQLPAVLAQDRDKVLVRIALVQEHRLAERRVPARAGGGRPAAAPAAGEKSRK